MQQEAVRKENSSKESITVSEALTSTRLRATRHLSLERTHARTSSEAIAGPFFL